MGSGSKVTVWVVETFGSDGNLSSSLAEANNKDSFNIRYKPLSKATHMGKSWQQHFSTNYLKSKDLPSNMASPSHMGASDTKSQSWVDIYDLVNNLASKVNFLMSENIKLTAKVKSMNKQITSFKGVAETNKKLSTEMKVLQLQIDQLKDTKKVHWWKKGLNKENKIEHHGSKSGRHSMEIAFTAWDRPGVCGSPLDSVNKSLNDEIEA